MKLLLYIRAFAGLLFFLFDTFLGCVFMLFNAVVNNRAYGDWVIRTWARLAVWFSCVDIRVEGLENLPKEGCLFVFNHTSHFDIVVICAVNPKSSRFGAKVELFSIPLFGRAMRVAGVLPIIRTDRAKVFKLYDDSIARVHAGESFYLAGEGTRQVKPGVGEKFKAGPFIFAINGQFSIVPLVLHGVTDILPKGRFIPGMKQWRNKVILRILKPIPTTGLTLEDREALQIRTREIMTQAYQELEHSSNHA
jgi:1-acyl-sn-glycerol-3-phosphate acyltransferase